MEGDPVSRRDFLGRLLFTSFAATAVAALSPIPFYLVPGSPPGPRRIRIGTVGDFPPGSARKFDWGGRIGVAVHDGKNLRVLDASCTHQGCKVNWNGSERRFDCPCHGAKFGADGSPLQGPHRGPLASLPFRVGRDGSVEVGE